MSEIWKVDLNQAGTTRYTIYIRDAGVPVLLQEYKSPEIRNLVLSNIIEDLKMQPKELVVPYLYCYKLIEDDQAMRIMKSLAYSRQFLQVAEDVAKAKCREWSRPNADGTRTDVRFNWNLLDDPDPDIKAYKYGWGLKIPYSVLMKGINPYQFYKYLLSK